MWECSYSKEPLDFKLLWFRFLKKIWIVVLATVVGALLFTGIYVASRLISRGGRSYRVTDVLDVSYVGDTYMLEVDYFYFNYYTWNEVSKFEETINAVYEELGGQISKEEIRKSTQAVMEADIHHLYLYTTTNDPELSYTISVAFRHAMISFIENYDRMDGVTVLSEGTLLDITDLRITRAVVTGLIIGFLLSCICILIAEITDTSIRVPSTLEKRYHVPTLTAPSMEEYKVNCEKLLGGLHNIAIVPVDAKSIPKALVMEGKSIKVFDDVLGNAASLDMVKNCDACVITVFAGAHNGSNIERMLEQLGRNNIKVAASLLVGEDESLLKKYYHL